MAYGRHPSENPSRCQRRSSTEPLESIRMRNLSGVYQGNDRATENPEEQLGTEGCLWSAGKRLGKAIWLQVVLTSGIGGR